MIFAAFTPERIPLQWWQFPYAFQNWLQSAGGVAALALVVISLATIMRRHRGDQAIPSRWLLIGGSLTLLLYAIAGTARLADQDLTVKGYSFAILGGLCALITLLLPMLLGVLRMRWGRIWALARLAFKEAIRSRVVLVFSMMALVFLFYDFFADHGRKPENQVKNFVTIIYWSMTPLFLITASVLGAFNIPNDIKNQSIHTIVTKPVEKLEIVLGRFLGFAGILTLGLAVLTVLSYGYILRGVTPEAAKESFRARVPIFGNLFFFAEHKKMLKFENVGREYDYRSYIKGPHPQSPNAPKNFAFWEFDELPASLEDMESVSFEFTFDIFRLSKGTEGQKPLCTFVFADGRYTFPDQTERGPIEDMRRHVQEDRLKETVNRPKGTTTEEENDRIDKVMIDKYRYFEVANQEVTDYHTLSIKVPGYLIKKLREQDQLQPRPGEPGQRKPALVVVVNVVSDSQMVGAARHDLYILEADQPFWINFGKGVIGMWFSFLVVLGIAIACSTYLSGVISWLVTMFLFGTGLFSDYIRELANNRTVGGGPIQALASLIERRGITTPPDDTPLSGFITGTDDVYRWWLQLFLHIIPDVNRFDLINYVSNGFDISWGEVLFLDNFVYVAGYLLIWVVLAYYLLKFREIANPT